MLEESNAVQRLQGVWGKARALLQSCGPSAIRPPISPTNPLCNAHMCTFEPRDWIHLRMQMEPALRLGLSWEELNLQRRRNCIPCLISLPCKFPGQLSQSKGHVGVTSPVYSFLCTPTPLWFKEIWEHANVLWFYEYVRVSA